MQPHAPKKMTWTISLIVAVISVIMVILAGAGTRLPLSEYSYWILLIGYVILFLGTFLKGF